MKSEDRRSEFARKLRDFLDACSSFSEWMDANLVCGKDDPEYKEEFLEAQEELDDFEETLSTLIEQGETTLNAHFSDEDDEEEEEEEKEEGERG